jgi:uncharacterized protein
MKFLLSVAAAVAIPASAASFDCKKAASPIEKAICANPRLDWLDEAMGMYYGAARRAAAVGQAADRDPASGRRCGRRAAGEGFVYRVP